MREVVKIMDKLRKLQMVELEILKEFMQICDGYNLRYYADGGTALGAVRHKGFIPWDDDIDVTMPREDYEIFCKDAYKRLNNSFQLQTPETTDDYIFGFASIVNKKVHLIYDFGEGRERLGYAKIDIFPLDGLPDGKLSRKVRRVSATFMKNLWIASMLNKFGNPKRKLSFCERVALWFSRKFNIHIFFNNRKRFIATEKFNKKYSYYDSKFCFHPWSTFSNKATLMTEWLDVGVKLPFEDIEIVVPKKFDQYLKHWYGEYTQLPSENERNWHALKEIIFVSSLLSSTLILAVNSLDEKGLVK